MNNKHGFTLLELIITISIILVFLLILYPTVVDYIDNSKKDKIISIAEEYIESTRNLLVAEKGLPSKGAAVVVPVDTIKLERAGKSPYTDELFTNQFGRSYVIVYNAVSELESISEHDYVYAITLNDESESCLELVSEKFLENANDKEKRNLINSSCEDVTKITESMTTAIFNDVRYYSDELKKIPTHQIEISYYK